MTMQEFLKITGDAYEKRFKVKVYDRTVKKFTIEELSKHYEDNISFWKDMEKLYPKYSFYCIQIIVNLQARYYLQLNS